MKHIRPACALLAALVAAAALTGCQNNTDGSESSETTAATIATSVPASTAAPVTAASGTDAHTHEEETEQPTTMDILIPTEGEGGVTFFEAVYAPDSKAEDIKTGRAVPLEQCFGKDSKNATLAFYKDGSFVENLGASGKRSGMYHVENGAIRAIYLPDRNMDITVTQWSEDGKTPVTFCVVYRVTDTSGFKVFYAEK